MLLPPYDTRETLARLEKAKVITGYGVRLGQRVVDGGLQAYVGIKVQPRSGKEVVRRLSAMAQVQQLCAVSGEFDYVAWLRTDSPEQLDQLLDQIGSVDGVEKTTTSTSSWLPSAKARRCFACSPPCIRISLVLLLV